MIRLVYASGERGERELLREAAISHSEISLLGVARDGQEAVQMAVQSRPDVVVLADHLRVLNGFEAAGLITSAAPGVKPLLITDDENPQTLRKAMQVGARRCMPRPAPPERILEAAMHIAEMDEIRSRPEYRAALDPSRFPRVVAVTGAKGGVGKTSLATNLAVALARADQGPTCMVDLYTQFGDVATMLNVHARQTLVDLVNLDDEIDIELLQSAMVEHPSGLHVLLGSSTPQALDALPTERLEQVFSALRLSYRFIVVDVPPMLHQHTLHVLETAHLVLLVCNLLDLTTVTDTARLVKSIRNSFVPKERLRLILNRVSRQNQLATELVEKSLGLQSWVQIPNDDQLVTQCTNRGTPFVLSSPNHPVSQAVRQIAQTLIETPEKPQVIPQKEQTERKGFFHFLSRNGVGAA